MNIYVYIFSLYQELIISFFQFSTKFEIFDVVI